MTDGVRRGADARAGSRSCAAHRPIVLDGAHNVDGAARCGATLAEEFTLAGSVVMVIGLLQGRDPLEMLEAIGATEAGFVVACTPPSPRALPAPELAAAADKLGIACRGGRRRGSAVSRALAVATDDDLVLVTGSHYVVGDARRSLLADTQDIDAHDHDTQGATTPAGAGAARSSSAATRSRAIASGPASSRPDASGARRDRASRTTPPPAARSRRDEPMVKTPTTIERMRRTGRAAAEILRRGRGRGRARRHHRRARRHRATRRASAAAATRARSTTAGSRSRCARRSTRSSATASPTIGRCTTATSSTSTSPCSREGVHGDTNATFFVGAVDPASRRLVRVTRECLERGIAAVAPGRPISDIGRAIEDHAKAHRSAWCGRSSATASATEFHTDLEILHYYDARAARSCGRA